MNHFPNVHRSVNPIATLGDHMATSATRGSASLAPTSAASQLVPCGTNVVVLRGVIRRDPEYRSLPSGDELLSFDLTVREDELPAESVPVAWLNPAVSAARLAENDDVVVIGRVRRRFFRAAGTTASRTEVLAEKVLSARSFARIRTSLESHLAGLNLE